jgi:hypothetical protein
MDGARWPRAEPVATVVAVQDAGRPRGGMAEPARFAIANGFPPTHDKEDSP